MAFSTGAGAGRITERSLNVLAVARRRTPQLVIGRIAEQASLGIVTLALARWLPVGEFAAASVLLIVNSLAVTLADLGLGYAVLALPVDRAASKSSLDRVRHISGAVLVLAVSAGWLLGGSVGLTIAGSGLIWALASESYIRGAGALRSGHAASVAVAHCAGGAALVLVTLSIAPGRGTLVLTVGLAAMHLTQILIPRGWRRAFELDGVPVGRAAIWGSQVGAVLIANADYAVAALLLGGQEYAVYLLAFRFAAAPTTLLANVAVRVGLLDLAGGDDAAREECFHRSVGRLFAVGTACAIGIVALAPGLSVIAGDDYQGLSNVLLIVAIGIPWRMINGQSGSLAIVEGAALTLAKSSVLRLLIVVLVATIGATGAGLIGLATAVTASTVLLTMSVQVWACRRARIRSWPALAQAGLVTLVLLGLVSVVVGS